MNHDANSHIMTCFFPRFFLRSVCLAVHRLLTVHHLVRVSVNLRVKFKVRVRDTGHNYLPGSCPVGQQAYPATPSG